MPSEDTQFKAVHGRSMKVGVPNDPTYVAWYSMRQRCLYARHKSYPQYGGAGVTICARWDSFVAFLEDVGERPPGTTLDRWPDGRGNYEPGNVRWATHRQQAQNRRSTKWIKAFGETLPMIEWCRRFGIAQDTLAWRLKKGALIEDALTLPVKSQERRACTTSSPENASSAR